MKCYKNKLQYLERISDTVNENETINRKNEDTRTEEMLSFNLCYETELFIEVLKQAEKKQILGETVLRDKQWMEKSR